jgi:glycosyltransferase involved in cell wall biosynthesis
MGERALRVSVVTPAYNYAQCLETTMQSVLTQGPDVEYIVIDDGSTDGSVDIIKRYADRLAYWETGPNRGQTPAINRGWRRATGDIVAYLNADDTYTPGSIAAVVQAFQEHPEVDVVYGDVNTMDADGRIMSRVHAEDFEYLSFVRCARSIIPQVSSFMRRSLLERCGLLNDRMQYWMDFEFWLRALRDVRVLHIPVALANYRFHPLTKTSQLRGVAAEELIQIYEAFFQQPQLDGRLRAIEREAMANAYAEAAEVAFAGLLPGATRRYLFKSLRIRPRLPSGELFVKLVVTFTGSRGIAAAKALYRRVTRNPIVCGPDWA